MALDGGLAISRKSKAMNAADAAVLAGGMELPDTTRATNAANQVIDATYPGRSGMATITSAGNTFTVTVTDPVPTSFAKLAGVSEIRVRAVAQVTKLSAPVNEMPGDLTPWAIEQDAYDAGQPITLKLGGGGGQNGNFHILALGGTGASNYQNNIMYGYQGTLGSGDILTADSEPGAKVGPTADGVEYRIGLATSNPAYGSDTETSFSSSNPRIVICPMVSTWIDVLGRSIVEIVGFAAVYLVGIQGGDVVGRFVSIATPRGRTVSTRPAAQDFGVYGLKMTL
jgi:hypothetical protein